MLPETERWVPVVGNARYEISDQGRVRRVASARGARVGRILKKRFDCHGYSIVSLFRGGARSESQERVHRLVCSAFLRPPLHKEDTNHKNGIKADNRLENLEWCTRSQNVLHAYATGLQPPRDLRGENNPRAKLTSESVLSIRERVRLGERQTDLAREHGVTKQTISMLVRGHTWTHAP